MLHLLKIEWKKFKHYRAFRVMAILYLALLPLSLLTLRSIALPPELPISQDAMFRFPDIWKILGYVGNWLVFFCLGFISILMVTSEYSNRTLRQNIITGMSRREYFMAKFSFILAVSLVATLYFVLIGLISGFMTTDNFENKILLEIDRVPRYFLMCVGYMIMGFFVGTFIRRSGIALFVFLIYNIFLEVVIRWAIHYRLFESRSIHFYPMNAVEDLAPNPFLENADNFTREMGFSMFLSPTEAVITTLCYSSLFLWLTYRYFQRTNL